MEEDIEIELSGLSPVPWSEFLLNPRQVRGSDFLMRWSQGEWSEMRLAQAINNTNRYVAFPYGPSSVAPEDDLRAYELYFERLEAAGLGKMKRPDLLIFRKSDEARVQAIIDGIGGESELPFIPEEAPSMVHLLSMAIIAVECENSLWITQMMRHFGTPLRPQKRLGGLLGLAKDAKVPTIIIKEEDRVPLRNWQIERRVSIHVWHAFYDRAYGLAFDTADELIAAGKIVATSQIFQAPGGATTTKEIYKIYYHYAYPLGESVEEPELLAASLVDKSGHILPYVKFEGGKLEISSDALAVLEHAAGNIE
ncbi:MAG: AccI family restriction endonuclease [Ktedonobacterales bacterium]